MCLLRHMWTQPIGKAVILPLELEECIHLPQLKVTHRLGVKVIMFKHMPSLVLGMNLVFREFSSYCSLCQKVSNHCAYKHEVVQLFSNCTLLGITGSCDAWGVILTTLKAHTLLEQSLSHAVRLNTISYQLEIGIKMS